LVRYSWGTIICSTSLEWFAWNALLALPGPFYPQERAAGARGFMMAG